MAEYIRPAEIERASFEIIRRELAERGICLPEEGATVILRCIHATADFDFAETICFSRDAVQAGMQALSEGCTVITDTNMALAGLSKPALEKLSCKTVCFMTDPAVAETAKEKGITRAAAAVDYAAERFEKAVWAFGNAPTALFRLAGQIEAGFRPALVIAVPVGFVNVTESKEQIRAVCERHCVPLIAALGRKGGSTVCAAVCNALLYGASGMLDPAARGWN